MPRINHDADRQRMTVKHGVPGPKKQVQNSLNNHYQMVRSARTWLEIHREHLRWKKTPDYLQWRHKQFLKQGGTCYYCDEPLNGTRINDEHIIPKIAGGSNRRSNLALACWKCNKEKYVSLLSKKELRGLETKNRKKRGTYHKLRELYPSEDDLAERLREFCQ